MIAALRRPLRAAGQLAHSAGRARAERAGAGSAGPGRVGRRRARAQEVGIGVVGLAVAVLIFAVADFRRGGSRVATLPGGALRVAGLEPLARAERILHRAGV